jgi:hypothetical protein
MHLGPWAPTVPGVLPHHQGMCQHVLSWVSVHTMSGYTPIRHLQKPVTCVTCITTRTCVSLLLCLTQGAHHDAACPE